MPATTGAFSNAMAPGIRRIFFMHLKDRPKDYEKVFSIGKSTRNYEEFSEMAALGTMPTKPEGTSIIYQDFIEGGKKRFTHVTYGLGFRITEEAMEDDLYNVLNRHPKALKRSAGVAVETAAFNVFNNSFSTEFGYSKFGVNEALVGTTHTLLGGGTGSNRPVTDADIASGSLEAAILNFNTLNDERGMPLDLHPRMLLFHPSDLFLVQEMLQSEYKPFTGNNEVNPLKGRLEPFWSRYLTDTDAWWVIAEDMDEDGPLLLWRRQLRLQNGDDFDSGDAKFKATQRFSVGVSEWRYLYGSTGA